MDTNIPIYPDQGKGTYPIGGDIKTLCQRYMSYHVITQMRDGSQFDGIIEGMDEDGVTMLVPEEVDGEERENDPSRQPYGRRRYRRFRRQRFPFFHFAFPFFIPYPYYYPYYPYYGYE